MEISSGLYSPWALSLQDERLFNYVTSHSSPEDESEK